MQSFRGTDSGLTSQKRHSRTRPGHCPKSPALLDIPDLRADFGFGSAATFTLKNAISQAPESAWAFGLKCHKANEKAHDAALLIEAAGTVFSIGKFRYKIRLFQQSAPTALTHLRTGQAATAMRKKPLRPGFIKNLARKISGTSSATRSPYSRHMNPARNPSGGLKPTPGGGFSSPPQMPPRALPGNRSNPPPPQTCAGSPLPACGNGTRTTSARSAPP